MYENPPRFLKAIQFHFTYLRLNLRVFAFKFEGFLEELKLNTYTFFTNYLLYYIRFVNTIVLLSTTTNTHNKVFCYTFFKNKWNDIY